MGGFTFPSSSPRADSGRLTLTTRDVALLAECFCQMWKEKTFWIKVIERVIMGLVVTELKINTLGLIFCALIMYVLWWYKPRLVKEPTTLAGDWVGHLCAYMYMSSRISDGRNTANKREDRKTNPEMSSVAFFPGKTLSTILR
ncbi:hypothetical protein ABVK25_010632 [Lepraria finkii]|uniref:Uncharacterized protein n=1 Tax=Lepraria finkii TaxID=1340010 RepID=A0ABR4AUF5_9LECA